MPIVSMATPFTHSNIYLVPSPENMRQRIEEKKRSHKFFKAIQLFLLILSWIPLIVAYSGSTIRSEDVLLNIVLGSCITYNLLALCSLINYDSYGFAIMNAIFGLLLVAAGGCSLFYTINYAAENSGKTAKFSYVFNAKITGAATMVLSSVLYFCEAVFRAYVDKYQSTTILDSL